MEIKIIIRENPKQVKIMVNGAEVLTLNGYRRLEIIKIP